MTTEDQQRTPAVSLRLDQVLRVYAHDLDLRTLADLRADIAAGRHRWFHDEFAHAIAEQAYTVDEWCAAIGTAVDGSPPAPSLPDQQLRIWQAVFPSEPFPRR
jgi:hypothetical protein